MNSGIDLNRLSLAELRDLKKRVDKAVEGFADRQRQDALAQLDVRARELGFASLSVLIGEGTLPQARKRTPTLPKYRNPGDADDTWSGRGRKPRWFVSALAAGKSPDDLLI